jgi:hypothetical protein
LISVTPLDISGQVVNGLLARVGVEDSGKSLQLPLLCEHGGGASGFDGCLDNVVYTVNGYSAPVLSINRGRSPSTKVVGGGSDDGVGPMAQHD